MGERTFSSAEKMKAAEREVALRRNVYRRKVEAGTMKQEAAEREIEIMVAIAADYRERAEAERLI